MTYVPEPLEPGSFELQDHHAGLRRPPQPDALEFPHAPIAHTPARSLVSRHTETPHVRVAFRLGRWDWLRPLPFEALMLGASGSGGLHAQVGFLQAAAGGAECDGRRCTGSARATSEPMDCLSASELREFRRKVEGPGYRQKNPFNKKERALFQWVSAGPAASAWAKADAYCEEHNSEDWCPCRGADQKELWDWNSITKIDGNCEYTLTIVVAGHCEQPAQPGREG